MRVPAVSVIIPVHNAERHLWACLDSVANQTLADIEIICVDDGSTDASRAILEEYRAADPRVVVVDGPGEGSAGAARNTGLDQASGTYLSFLDADDLFAPTMLAELRGKALTHDADVVITRYRSFDEVTGETTPVDGGLQLDHVPSPPFSPAAVGDQLFLITNPAAWNKLFRTDFIRRTGLRFQHLRRTNDAYFTFMALAHATRISYLNAYPITYRTGNTDSLQGSRDKSPLDFVEAIAAMRARLEASGLFATYERAFVNRALDLGLFNLRNATNVESFRTVHHALVTDVLPRFGITGREPGYFVRRRLADQLADLERLSAEEFLFTLLKSAEGTARTAQGEAHRAWREASVMARSATDTEDASPSAPALAGDIAAGDAGSAPDLSVVIAVYNAEEFLRECVASVQRQTGVGLEIVAVDDGSTDSSGEILDQLASDDPRIRVVHQANGGLSIARNAGLAVASGRFVCFLDSDDRWDVDAASTLVERADAGQLDVLLFDATAFRDPGVDDRTWKGYDGYYRRGADHESPASGQDLFARLVAAEEYRSSACLYLASRDLLQRTGLQFYPGIVREDNLFTFSLLLAAGRAAHVSLPLYGRRVRPGSIMTASNRFTTARGFYITYLEMQRLVAGRHYQPAVATEIGRIIQSIFRLCRDNYVRLDADGAEHFADIDPAPDGQALFLILRRLRREFQAGRGPSAARSAPPATVVGRLRRFAGRARRSLLGS